MRNTQTHTSSAHVLLIDFKQEDNFWGSLYLLVSRSLQLFFPSITVQHNWLLDYAHSHKAQGSFFSPKNDRITNPLVLKSGITILGIILLWISFLFWELSSNVTHSRLVQTWYLLLDYILSKDIILENIIYRLSLYLWIFFINALSYSLDINGKLGGVDFCLPVSQFYVLMF